MSAPGASGDITADLLASREESVQVPLARPGEEELDRSLRPPRLDDFVGQEELKDQL